MNRGSLKIWATSLAVIAVAGATLATTGCEQKMLTTATVDTTKLLQADDDYQRLAQEYYNARVELAGKLQKEISKTGNMIKDQATYDKFAKAEADLNSEWLKITRDFTEKKMEKVRKVCDNLHETKGIDLVLLDSAQQPTVEYGAIDVTADVLVGMSSFAGDQGKDESKDAKAEKKDEGGKEAK